MHRDGLFLVYTHKDDSNEEVKRWRAPWWMRKVDTENHRLRRSTEKIVLPLGGHGDNAPEDDAFMDNFNVTDASPGD